MKSLDSVQLLVVLEPLLCASLLTILLVGRHYRNFRFLSSYIGVRLATWIVLTSLMHFKGINVHLGYKLYFYLFWLSFALEATLSFGIVHDLYQLAMAPLPGLQRLGMLMFRWATGIAFLVAAGIAIGPHISSQHYVIRSVLQLQQTEGILTLCLLLFVTFAIRPMGLSQRSRIFGVSVGLGILAASDLVTSSWLSHVASMVSMVNVLSGVAFVTTMTIWTIYFVLPEPKRQLIVLPTTSPFLRWNQISAALGDAPGFVAIGGIDPSFLAPAEVEVMERASVMMDSLAAKA